MRNYFLILVLMAAAASQASAHGGRRFEIVVTDGRLAARGYISTGVDDQGGVIRPYQNALHDHWANSLIGGGVATADLPGFDIFAADQSFVGGGAAEQLAGSSVTLTLIDGAKWESPPMPPAGTPDLVPLTSAELIAIGLEAQFVDTETPGDLTLAPNVASAGVTDIDLSLATAGEPDGVLQVLRWRLSTSEASVDDSADVFMILAPDGSAGNGLHHQSLYLERYLGTPLAVGDLNRDGVVSEDDFSSWATAYGSASLYAGSGADANRDQIVSAADYALLRGSLAPATPAAVATPEPTTMVLAFAGLGLLSWRRRPSRR